MKRPVNHLYLLMAKMVERYHRGTPMAIVFRKRQPVWLNAPPEPVDLGNRYWWLHTYATIVPRAFVLAVRRGWLVQRGDGAWVVSALGCRRYRDARPGYHRPGRGLARLSRYRKLAKRQQLIVAHRAAALRPEVDPPPAPARQGPRRGKYRHPGYRRACTKDWLQEWEESPT